MSTWKRVMTTSAIMMITKHLLSLMKKKNKNQQHWALLLAGKITL
jgi:hypothetical protein